MLAPGAQPPAVVPAAHPDKLPAELAAPLPEPPVTHGYIRANRYVNEAFGFEMYAPPGWDLIADAADTFPNALAALGAGDETAALVISRERASNDAMPDATDHLDSHAAATDHRLRSIYENYRVQSSTRTTVAGLPGVEQRANGVADGKDWSVRVITFGRGNDVFTIMAMTYANSDLIQIRQNVIAKMIASTRFYSDR
jgi:hypothetical protein